MQSYKITYWDKNGKIKEILIELKNDVIMRKWCNNKLYKEKWKTWNCICYIKNNEFNNAILGRDYYINSLNAIDNIKKHSHFKKVLKNKNRIYDNLLIEIDMLIRERLNENKK